MKAMILAAGRGERMRPLTDHTPKPLLEVAGKPLIEHLITRLKAFGYSDIVINTHHLGKQIEHYLEDGQRYAVRIQYSPEAPQALETGGGIFQALPKLGDGPFLVINSDIWSDCDLTPPTMDDRTLAYLILVENPAHNPNGDFGLTGNRIANTLEPGYTFSGIGWYRAALFRHCEAGRFPLAPLLRSASSTGRVSGRLCRKPWVDVGTPERLASVERELRKR